MFVVLRQGCLANCKSVGRPRSTPRRQSSLGDAHTAVALRRLWGDRPANWVPMARRQSLRRGRIGGEVSDGHMSMGTTDLSPCFCLVSIWASVFDSHMSKLGIGPLGSLKGKPCAGWSPWVFVVPGQEPAHKARRTDCLHPNLLPHEEHFCLFGSSNKYNTKTYSCFY